MRVQLLGPVRVWRDGEELDLGAPRQRAVFALLAAAAGNPVMRAELVDMLWSGHPPPTAANVIFTYIKHLRRLLEPDRRRRAASTLMPSVGDGYALHAPADGLDLARFRRLVSDATLAQRNGDHARAAGLFGEALELWQGPPLADIGFLAGHPKVVALADERWAAVARYGDAMIAVGAASDAVPALQEAATALPLDEAAQVRLIRAYQRAGRQGQAFATYDVVRRRLADELGVDPGPDLVAAHAALVHGDRPSATRPTARPASNPAEPDVADQPAVPPTTSGRTAPAQLPNDLAAFIGRIDHLRQLDKLLSTEDGSRSTAVVACIAGTAGVGKTTLAVHWAHRVADRFPDGQLYVNLGGFGPVGEAMPPNEAVRGFLDALGVPPQGVPADPQAQTGLFRSMLAGRRMLVLLDNARDAGQIRPLLPGSAGCLALVTSRNELSGLVVTEDARSLRLDLLSTTEARELLAHRIGHDRVSSEPSAVDEIITRCSGLPLALAVVAARAAARPGFPLDALAGELRVASAALDSFAGADTATNLRAVFSWSYRTLNDSAARLFRLIGLHPGPDLTVPVAASLAGVPVSQVRPLLAELTGADLVTEHQPGRYLCHDLLRAYATELANSVDAADERQAAVRRMLDHYLHTAHHAALLLDPHRDPIALGPAETASTVEELATHPQALAWFSAEHHAMLKVITHAAGSGFDTHTWQLAWSVADFLGRRGHWHDLVASQGAALQAAQRLADPHPRAHAHRNLARAYSRLGRFDDAHSHLQHALDLFNAFGDRAQQATTHQFVGVVFEQQGRHDAALSHAQRALDLFRAIGHRSGQANALNGIGWCHAQLGDHRQAITYCEQALALLRETGDRYGEATTIDSLGYAHHHLGHHDQAIARYQQAVDLYRELGDREGEGETLARVADTRLATGDIGLARATCRQALDIFEELDHPYTEQVRAKLHDLMKAAHPA